MSSNVSQFLTSWHTKSNVLEDVKKFTSKLGWYPNEAIIEKDKSTHVEGHVFVEHGLDNTAVISFLNEGKLFNELKISEVRRILSVSYNNLTDIHYIIDREKLCCINNLDRSEKIIYSRSIEDINLHTIILEESAKSYNSQKPYKALDESFINTIKKWQDRLYYESNGTLSNDSIANLFNVIIFLRAIEDHKGKNQGKKLLIDFIEDDKINSLGDLVRFCLRYYGIIGKSPFIDYNEIAELDKILGLFLIKKVISEFYESEYAPYTYNFAIMSKHSLSRIYEQFVKIFTTDYSPQIDLFGLQPLAKLVTPEKSGIYYTPEFIARFFARYSRDLIEIEPNFGMSMLEPAVGSGIFVRTYLEYRLAGVKDKEVIDNAFKQVEAFDINTTACKAANLSLSLLYLSLTGDLPDFTFNIKQVDSLDWYLQGNTRNKYNLIISNPPFISYHDLPENIRDKIKGILNNTSLGFPDLYFAFIKIAIESLKKDGIGMFVIPHTFLTSKSAGKLRDYLGKNAKINAIVDLSNTPTFESADVYPILLIFQKVKFPIKIDSQEISIVKAEANIGEALTKFLNNEEEIGSSFSVYKMRLPISDAPWYLHTPIHRVLLETLNQHKPLSEYFDVRTGMTAGNKNIFIQSSNQMILKDFSVWVPFAADKDLKAYQVLDEKHISQYFFYPYINNKLITEDELSLNFPVTYKFLLKHKAELQKRAEFKNKNKAWYSPNRPRKPSFMMVPKILTPHLCIIPKFSFDPEGKFAVARSPFICLKDEQNDSALSDSDMFFYLLGILHSRLAFWYISQHSDTYSAGYFMLERASLENLPIPAPNQILKDELSKFIDLVKIRTGAPINEQPEYDHIIDETVFHFYGLTVNEMGLFNIS